MYKVNTNLAGLSPEDVLTSRATHGENKIDIVKNRPILIAVKNAIKEPMLLLLAAASTLYFIHGDLAEGIFLLVAILLVSSISFYQESRSRNALDALKRLTQPKSKVIRNNKVEEIRREERTFTKTFFNIKELSTSIIQGLVITAGLVAVYWYAIHDENNLHTTTSMVFLTLISANITLTLVNRSFYYSIVTTIRYANNLIPIVIGVTLMMVIIIFLIVPLREFFRFGIPTQKEVAVSIAIGLISAIWFEGYKFLKRIARPVE